ncbi:MAG: hypothetical protein ACP5D2_00725 [Candidatus Nanoarchaeia archaeon]
MNLTYCNLNGKMMFGLDESSFSMDDGDSNEGKEIIKEKLTEENISNNREDDLFENYIFVNQTCEEFASSRGYDYWIEIDGCEECWDFAVESCGNISPSSIEECVSPNWTGREGETIRLGNCCVWSCHEPNDCEEYFIEHGYEYWAMISGDCKDFAEENCEYGVDRYILKQGNCCFWECKEMPVEIEPDEEICQDIDSGLDNDTITCYDGTSYSDYCANKSTLVMYRCVDDVCIESSYQCDIFCDEEDGCI